MAVINSPVVSSLQELAGIPRVEKQAVLGSYN